MAIIRCYWEDFYQAVELTLLAAPLSGLILSSLQDYTYTQVHIFCGLRVMCQGCLSTVSMFVPLLDRQRAQDCANECLAEGGWWWRRLLGSLGTAIRVFGGSCIHPEGLAVFVILADHNPIIRGWTDCFNESWVFLFSHGLVYFRVHLLPKHSWYRYGTALATFLQ